MFLSPVVLDVLRCASEAHTLPEQQWEGRRAMGEHDLDDSVVLARTSAGQVAVFDDRGLAIVQRSRQCVVNGCLNLPSRVLVGSHRVAVLTLQRASKLARQLNQAQSRGGTFLVQREHSDQEGSLSGVDSDIS